MNFIVYSGYHCGMYGIKNAVRTIYESFTGTVKSIPLHYDSWKKNH